MQVMHLPHFHPAAAYRLAGRLLVAMGAIFWLLSGAMGHGFSGAGVEGFAMPAAVPGLVLALLLAVAWRWELIGGMALLSWALFAAVYYPLYFGPVAPEELMFTVVALSLPPLLAGFFLLAAWGQVKRG
jgi:hypothetical protein